MRIILQYFHNHVELSSLAIKQAYNMSFMLATFLQLQQSKTWIHHKDICIILS